MPPLIVPTDRGSGQIIRGKSLALEQQTCRSRDSNRRQAACRSFKESSTFRVREHDNNERLLRPLDDRGSRLNNLIKRQLHVLNKYPLYSSRLNLLKALT